MAKAPGKISFLKLASAFALLTLITATIPVGPAFGAVMVENIATGSYSVGSLSLQVDSNKVSIMVRTPSQIEFLAYAPLADKAESVNVRPTSYLSSTGGYNALSGPVPIGSAQPLDLGSPLPLVKTKLYHEYEPVFVRLTDLDQNLDPLTEDTVLVTLTKDGTVEKETLLLIESGRDTGVFVGFIQSVDGAVIVPGNGLLSVSYDSTIKASYTDPVDGTDTSAAAVLVDPFGIVFDTATGLPVNGAVVNLLDGATGLPATVLGDDGISSYPSSITTGGTVTDSGGRIYTFRPGFYRFPYLQPGRYVLNVTPPPAYRAPSQVSTADIQNLPGAPFAMASPGSRGEIFEVNPGPAIHIDIPVDPVNLSLYLTKSVSKDTVAIGDFLQYKVTAENTGPAGVAGATVNDRLPLGFRYQSGSTRIDGAAGADPAVSADGRTLNFALGTIATGTTVTVSYVVEVAAGAEPGLAENIAEATGTGPVSSNIARAGVVVREDLFRSKTTIVGRVFPEGCGDEDSEKEGVAGVRIYLEDGAYAITDEFGMYHFEGVNPGGHVVQLDHATLPENYRLISCEENDRFAGTADAQFVDLKGGTMWRADFYALPLPLPEPVIIEGKVGLELSSRLGKDEGDGYLVEYRVALNLEEVPADNLRLTMLLPDGTVYLPGSSRLDGVDLAEPDSMGTVLTYRLGDREAGWHGQLRLTARPADDIGIGELPARALLTFDTGETKNRRTPLAENILAKKIDEERKPAPDITLRPHFEVFGYSLSEEDKVVLDEIIVELEKADVTSLHLTGHTDSTRIAPRSRHIVADNYELSRLRAKAVADYFVEKLGLPAERIISDGMGPDEPVATNHTVAGRALNRRVEVRIVSENVFHFPNLENIKDRSGLKEIEVKAVQAVETEAAQTASKPPAGMTMPELDQAWLNKAKPGLDLVWPQPGFYPAIPSMKIAVKHDPRHSMRLFLNGKEVDPLYLDGTKKRNDNAVAVSLWIGVHLEDGDNLLEVVEFGPGGIELNRQQRTIHYSGPPIEAELAPEYSKPSADGKTPPVIAVRFTDSEGHPAREGIIGEYSVDPPYLPLKRMDDLQKSPLAESRSERFKYVVGPEGIAMIRLQPTSKTGEATLRFRLLNGEKEVKSWLTPEERDWILVGLAEGTVGYNEVAGNMESISGSGVEDEYYDDGRLAFFAKGTIKGKWLLTAAYDSDRNGIRANDSLHGVIDPNQYYTLYGDASEQQYDAASARPLYLKIERNKFYTLFGDFATDLSVTELSRYNRNLNGLKAEMKGARYDFNIFASDTNQAFVKDEIRGDGTSGLYKLSRRNIVANSESIAIEARNRFRSEEIVSSKRLSRHLDYDIDYEAGTIFFKSPVYSRDENFNPIYIVVDFESYDPADLSFNYGGRGAVRFMGDKLEVGASHVHEGKTGGEGNLTGIDATLKLNEQTEIRAEVAATDKDFNGVSENGSAYLAEVEHRSEKLIGKAYVREQESGFGLGQQMGSETGTRKIGATGDYRLTEKVNLLGDASRQYNLATDGVRDVAEAKAQLSEEGYTVHGGLRHARDKMGDGEINKAEQLNFGGSYNILDNRVILRADHDQSLLRNNDHGDFPTRTTLGADYRLNETATLFVAQEFTQGDLEDTEMTRLGLKASPWTGGAFTSTIQRQYTENGARVFAVNGLQQTWQVTKKWSVDAGLDRSDTISHPGNTRFNANVPAASGSSTDFTALSAGAAYTEEKWAWNGRLELRNADNEDKYGIFTSLYGEVNRGLGLSAGLQSFRSETAAGLNATNANLRFGLAYRPMYTEWIILDRLDFLVDKKAGSDLDYDNRRVVNNLNANYRPNIRTQFSIQYGAKYVSETIDGDDYGGYTDLFGLEGRYDLTPKWDIGLRGAVLHSWDSEQIDYTSGVSVGHNLVKNFWVSLGYNFTGFKDRDFSRADFTSEGPYFKLRMKFDQNSVKDAVKLIGSL